MLLSCLFKGGGNSDFLTSASVVDFKRCKEFEVLPLFSLGGGFFGRRRKECVGSSVVLGWCCAVLCWGFTIRLVVLALVLGYLVTGSCFKAELHY